MKSSKSAKLNRLDDLTIRKLIRTGAPGWHNDGGGLYLKITGPNTASWVFRFRDRYMGLGAYPAIGLAQARADVQEPRRLVAAGADPLENRLAIKQQAQLDKAKNITFRECAELWLANKRSSWTVRTATANQGRLIKHIYPKIGDLPIKDIDTNLVLQTLQPVWDTIPVLANQFLRPHLEKIFDFAKLSRYRDFDSENPARWKGHLEHSGLPSLNKIHVQQSHKMLDYTELPPFLVALQNWDKRDDANKIDGTRARCLHFQILTTTRPGEAAGARWGIIPPERMKTRRPHLVPLPDQAMQILDEQRQRSTMSPHFFSPLGRRFLAAREAHPELTTAELGALIGTLPRVLWKILEDLKIPIAPSDYIFETRSNVSFRNTNYKPSPRKTDRRQTRDHISSPNLVRDQLIPMGYPNIVSHGFRASFSTWVNEETDYPRDLREFQLAHQVDDAVAAAYQRGTGIEKRRHMLQHWADYCHGIVTPKVVPFRRAGGQSGE